MTKNHKKPTKFTKLAYDYCECSDYLQKKYHYDERDYADYQKTGEYLDFWHWVIDNHDVYNGCYITFSKENLEDECCNLKDWQKEIYGRYIEEFADENGEVELYVWW